MKLAGTKSKTNQDAIGKVSDIEKLTKKQSIIDNFATSQRIDRNVEHEVCTKDQSINQTRIHELKDYQIKTVEKEL